MVSRLARLESSVTRLTAVLSNGRTPGEDEGTTSPGPSPATDAKPADQGPQDRPAKRVRLESPESTSPTEANGKSEANGCPGAATPEHDFARATELEAHDFIQGELADSSRNISNDRRSVLEAALDFIREMEHPPSKRHTIGSEKCVADITDALIAPTPEFFHMVLSGNLTTIHVCQSAETKSEHRKSTPISSRI